MSQPHLASSTSDSMISSSPQQAPILRLHQGILATVVILTSLLQVKSQGIGASLFDTYNGTMISFIIVILIYGITLSLEITFVPQNLNLGEVISGYSRLFGALATVLLLMMLVPVLGFASMVIWVSCFVIVAHSSHTKIWEMLCQFSAAFWKKLYQFSTIVWETHCQFFAAVWKMLCQFSTARSSNEEQTQAHPEASQDIMIYVSVN